VLQIIGEIALTYISGS